MMPELPPELTDRIIDFLWEDHQSLYSCALISRSWLPGSHFHLYSNMHLQSRENLDSLVHISRISHVGASLGLVRSLNLSDAWTGWVHRLPLVLGHAFSAIESLRIEDTDWNAGAIHPATLPFGFAHFRSLTGLDLYHCIFRNVRQFQYLVCALPRLQSLTMFDVTLHQLSLHITKPTSVRLPPLNNLSVSFRVSDTLLSSLFEWLRALPRSSLRMLAVRPHNELSSTIGEAIESFAAGLDSLDLTLDDSYTLTDMERLNLHRCTGLRTLSIWHQCSIPLAEILDLVAPSSRIHQLWLHVRVSQPEPEWARVRDVLASERFCQLQEVVFLLPPDEDDRLGPQKQRTVMGAVEDLRHRDVSVRVSNWSPPFRTI